MRDVRHGTVPLNGLVVFHASVALISGNLADGEIFGRRINKIGKQLRIFMIEPSHERDVVKPDESAAKSTSTDFKGKLVLVINEYRIGVSSGFSR